MALREQGQFSAPGRFWRCRCPHGSEGYTVGCHGESTGKKALTGHRVWAGDLSRNCKICANGYFLQKQDMRGKLHDHAWKGTVAQCPRAIRKLLMASSTSKKKKGTRGAGLVYWAGHQKLLMPSTWNKDLAVSEVQVSLHSQGSISAHVEHSMFKKGPMHPDVGLLKAK